MDEINNNNNDYNEINEIRYNKDECKFDFITNVISRNEIPTDFKKIRGSNEKKIFYEIKDGKEHKREWVYFLNTNFIAFIAFVFHH